MNPDQVASADIVASEFGATAVYTPLATGTPADINAVMSYGAEVVIGEVYELRDTAHVRASDIQSPAAGDSLAISDKSYTIDTWFRSGAMWQLILLPV